MKMRGNTMLVAGGASGIGRGLAELLHRLGNEVLVLGAPAGSRASPGLRGVDIDLADPWSVAAFAEQVAATCPGLNVLVDMSIAFPAHHLPGMQALLHGGSLRHEGPADRLGVQHLTGALLPQLRKRSHGAVMRVVAGPAGAPLQPEPPPLTDGSTPAFTMAVRKRWASARLQVVDIAPPSRAAAAPAEREGMSLAAFVGSVAGLLADGQHEQATLARLQALWPPAAVRETAHDRVTSEAF
ncbi:SDR family NAD(P)-dependent oxidoreductase [Pelomonas cellulosilytica]|uniref:SDR family NAD(P)-dependent oxidoreductase n=1 Tax=Pelomonas cellulosilytica TaxID=2906762 RepID=A0ABS8XXQ1_9BURK|nr:SDR family NAD(P)-dependent oxidoreductase [Pelomonas sp. P8]MCE4555478.1 SDR family NAD(P)-dependent oxidoreductase [Pelomonas sp. P8]